MGKGSSPKVVPTAKGEGNYISDNKMNPSWDKRIGRAVELANRYAFAKEALVFYRTLTSYQKDVYQHLESLRDGRDGLPSLEEELPLYILLPRFPSFVSLIRREGPPRLAKLAEELSKMREEDLGVMLQSYWREKALNTIENRAMSFFPKAFLQPYAECLADAHGGAVDGLAESASLCPLCNGRPQVGCLRPADNGMKRSLVCSLCLAEWRFRRLSCPSCGEDSNDKFPYYTTKDYPNIRLEACNSCGKYIKTVDMTKNPEAVPVVDELATIPLDLWAHEQGYKKIEDNVLGI
ncbi:MAG: formate dehydrogenase accessory protein FdhE [Candidatus Brocadiales bacterium]